MPGSKVQGGSSLANRSGQTILLWIAFEAERPVSRFDLLEPELPGADIVAGVFVRVPLHGRLLDETTKRSDGEDAI